MPDPNKLRSTYEKQKKRSSDRLETKKNEGNVIFSSYLTTAILRKCNIGCQYCYRSDDPAKMEENLLRRIMEYVEEHFFGIKFIGGEPTNRLATILEMSEGRDIHAILSTNGHDLNDEVVKEIKEVGNIVPVISIDGSSSESHDYSRIKGSFDKVLDSIEVLHKYKVPFGVNTVVNSNNFKDVTQGNMIDFLNKNYASAWSLTRYYPIGSDDKHMVAPLLEKEQYLRLEQFREEIRQRSDEFYFEWNGSEGSKSKDRCPAVLTISEDGSISYCPFLVWGVDRINADDTDPQITKKLQSKLDSWQKLIGSSSHFCPLYSNTKGTIEWARENGSSLENPTGMLVTGSRTYNAWREATNQAS